MDFSLIPGLGDNVKVTIIATGFDKTRDAYMEEELQSQRERFAKLMNQYYGTAVRRFRLFRKIWKDTAKRVLKWDALSAWWLTMFGWNKSHLLEIYEYF